MNPAKAMLDGRHHQITHILTCARDICLEQRTTPIESPQTNGMAEAFVRTIKRDYVRVSPRPNAETVMRQLSSWITPTTTRFTRTRLLDIVHPVSSSQLAEIPDRVRSFGGDNGEAYRIDADRAGALAYSRSRERIGQRWGRRRHLTVSPADE